MGDVPVGHRAANLPWLCPAGTSLFALADEHPDADLLAADPAVVVLVLRYSRPTPSPTNLRLDPVAFCESLLPEAAARHLTADAGGIYPRHTCDDVLRFARSAARMAAGLADRTRVAPPAAAWAAALLAPLGWLLVGAADPGAAADCRDAIRGGEDAPLAQTRLWGLTNDGIVRRAAARWRLPDWISAVVCNLGLSIDVATRLGAPRGLFDVVQSAVAACESDVLRLGLTRSLPHAPERELARVAVSLARDTAGHHAPAAATPSVGVPTYVLAALLKTAARARRAEAAVRLDQLQTELDRYRLALRTEGERFDARVRDAKLAALAELAAGAGHEINNPLAVISGNAQLLLAGATDPDSRKALESVGRQARRISDIVNDLMHFARPRPPTPQTFDAAGLVNDVVQECRPVAVLKGVELRATVPAVPVAAHADPRRLERALAAVVRNGIEAVPTGGWVRVRIDSRGGSVTVVVEDSGGGPGGDVAEHMFDPFYSGRSAGRGRGLGLPTAWRLARENGGDLRFAPADDSPSRFVLEVPLASRASAPPAERKSA